MKTYQDIERSIITRFRKDIWSKFIKAVIDYKLIEENDNIMVCISGGKDSFLLAKLMQEVQVHGKYPFTIHFVVMDPGYKKNNRKLIEENAKKLNIPIEIHESDIFEVVDILFFLANFSISLLVIFAHESGGLQTFLAFAIAFIVGSNAFFNANAHFAAACHKFSFGKVLADAMNHHRQNVKA